MYHIVFIGRQWLIKDWNEGNMVVMSGSVEWNAWSIEQLKVQILRERQLLHLMVLSQPKTRGLFQIFILDYQDSRIGAFRWRQWESLYRLLQQRQRPSHIHYSVFLILLHLSNNSSLTNNNPMFIFSSSVSKNNLFNNMDLYGCTCTHIYMRW